ncbi:hypothetical protein DPMN_162130 [Dreissena polymorpha]|uniref:Uncharacterized protein n=1 Tax=Dreissena polymorpha TaxID=45954 RepID=A0A9D4ER17_DREPO|nr:hypothetical protein DPMN_162130 [Dreissena polymorpha]
MEGCVIEEEQRRSWVSILTDIIDEGPHMVLRLPKIRQAILSHPDPLLWFCKKRLELELLCLKLMVRIEQCKDENGSINWSDTVLQATAKRRAEILREVHQRMCSDGSRVYDMDEIDTSMLM